MPEFILNTEGAGAPWLGLDSFTQGFIEAAFFSDTCAYDSSEFFTKRVQRLIAEGQADGTIPNDSSVADIDVESFCRIKDFCDDFQKRAAELLEQAYGRDYDESQAGRDLYFTYAGHGVGYWSRDVLENDSAEYERLTAIMVAASESGDNAAWDSACRARDALKSESLGERLSAMCGRGEINLDAYRADYMPSGFHVRFDIH